MTETIETSESIIQYLKNADREGYMNAMRKLMNDPIQFLHVQDKISKYVITKNKEKNLRYTYLVTFTLRPVHHASFEKLLEPIEKWLNEQLSRGSLCIVKGEWSREYTKQGIPHWHLGLMTTKPVHQKVFQNFKNLYGFVKVDKTRGKFETSDDAMVSILTYVRKYSETSGVPKE